MTTSNRTSSHLLLFGVVSHRISFNHVSSVSFPCHGYMESNPDTFVGHVVCLLLFLAINVVPLMTSTLNTVALSQLSKTNMSYVNTQRTVL